MREATDSGPGERAALQRMLIQLRVRAGLDQTTLAARLKITQSEVSKFERGERALGVIRLRGWLHALGVDFAHFAAALDRELERLDRRTGSSATASSCAPPIEPIERIVTFARPAGRMRRHQDAHASAAASSTA